LISSIRNIKPWKCRDPCRRLAGRTLQSCAGKTTL
jgi:hypothetical protein